MFQKHSFICILKYSLPHVSLWKCVLCSALRSEKLQAFHYLLQFTPTNVYLYVLSSVPLRDLREKVTAWLRDLGRELIVWVMRRYYMGSGIVRS